MYRSRVKPFKFKLASKMRQQPTDAERKLRTELYKHPAPYRWTFQSIVAGFILDFYCPRVRVAVEVDGSSHNKRKAYDEARDAVLKTRLGIITLRFSNKQVLAHPAAVADQILRVCKSAPQYATWNEGRKKKE